jgi:hypothetical protein
MRSPIRSHLLLDEAIDSLARELAGSVKYLESVAIVQATEPFAHVGADLPGLHRSNDLNLLCRRRGGRGCRLAIGHSLDLPRPASVDQG